MHLPPFAFFSSHGANGRGESHCSEQPLCERDFEHLDRFFFAVRDHVYAILKLDEDFPSYYGGTDIDVLCYDRDAFARSILEVGNSYLNRGFEITATEKSDSFQFK